MDKYNLPGRVERNNGMKNIGMKNIGMKKNINEQREGIWGESLKSLKSLMQIFAESANSANSANSAKQIFATFATFAMQIFSNLVNFVKLVMQIFAKGEYSAVRVSSVQRPTNIQRISNLSLTIRPIYNRFTTNSILSRLCLVSLILMLLILGGFSSSMWGNTLTLSQSNIVESGTNKGKVVVETTHARFILSSTGGDIWDGDGGDNGLGVYDNFPRKTKNTECVVLTWEKTVASGSYSIKVVGISFYVHAFTGLAWGDASVYFNEAKVNGDQNIRVGSGLTWYGPYGGTNNSGYGNVKIGFETSTGTAGQTYDCHIKDFVITYKIVPTTPTTDDGSDDVTVTVDLDDKQTIDVSSLFSLSNPAADFTYEYDCYSQSGGAFTGSNFYSTKAGDFSVRARIAESSNCHEASEWSEDYSITVNRRTPTLTLDDDAETEVDLTVDEKSPNYFDLTSVIDEYIGDGKQYYIVSSAISSYGHIDGNNFYATKKGDYTIRISSPQGDHYTDTFSDDATYRDVTITVRGKATPTFTMNYTQATADALLVGDTIKNAFSFTNVSNDEDFTFATTAANMAVIKSGSDVITYDATNNWIVARNKGTATLQFTQDETSAYEEQSSDIFRFTVAKKTPSFTGSAYNDLKVDDVQTADYSYSNVSAAKPTASSDDDFYYTIDDISYTNLSKNKKYNSLDSLVRFNPDTKLITALNAGSGKITLHQKETYEYTGATTSFDVTVSKHENAVSCATENWTNSINFEEEIGLSSNNSTAPLIVTRTSGDENLTTYNAETKKIEANFRAGTATWSVSQAEDYMYKAATAQTLTVTVGTLPCVECYLYEYEGDNSTTANDYKDANGSHAWTEVGVADKLLYKLKQQDGKGSVDIKVGCKEGDATAFGDFVTYSTSYTDSYESKELSLTSTAVEIQFRRTGSSGTKKGQNPFMKDVRVTRKQWFKIKNAAGDAEITELTMPSRILSGDSTVATFKVDYSTCAPKIKVASDNPHIVVNVSDAEFSSTTHGVRTITLKYSSAAAEKITDAKVTIYSTYDHETLTVKAETKGKLSTTIEYKGADSYAVNAANMNATDLFQVRDENGDLVESPVITLSSNATSVIGTVSENTAIDFLCGGSATITASYAGDATYAAASDLGQAIKVNKLNDVITWNGVAGDGKIHVTADHEIPYTIASALTTTEKPIRFTTRNASIVSVTPGVTSDALYAQVHGTVWLVAETNEDCTYSSKKDSIQIEVDYCKHNIVWTQNLTSFATNEAGNISQTYTLDAIAKDSIGNNSGVEINYSLSNTSFARIEDGNKLVLFGEGETVITATTAASDKYATVSEAREVRVKRPGVNTVASKNNNNDVVVGDAGKRKIVITGPHAQFTFSGATDIYYYGYDGYALASDFGGGDRDYYFDWVVTTPNCSIEVTRISFWSKAYNSGAWYADNAKVQFGTGDTKNVGTAALTSTEGDYAKFSKEENLSSHILMRCSSDGPNFDFYIKNIVIEYKIYTSAPTVKNNDASVYVTVDPDVKNTINLSDCFYRYDENGDFSYSYQLASDYDGHAGIYGVNQFWADAAGEYQVQAKVNVAGDHYPSEWSSPKTITVNRLPNTILVNGEADYSTTMTMRNTMDVAFTSTNTNYESTPFVCEATTGSDWMSYSASTASTGQIESGEVLGTTTFHVSQPQDSQYEAAEATFTVELTNDTYEFHGDTDEDWGKVSNWTDGDKPTENDNVTVTGNLVIDEEIEVYSLDISGEGTVTIDPTGGLTVGAGGITGATVDNLKLAASSDGKTGYLRVSPRVATMPQATVELYSIGYYDLSAEDRDNIGSWQYVGIPIVTSALAKTIYTDSWIYTWDETTGGWINNRKRLVMSPFEGYATSQYSSTDGIQITHKGTLVSPQTVNVPLSYTSSSDNPGCNVLANSFAAPIDITKFDISDFSDGVESTINLFNTGSKNDIASRVNQAVGMDVPGQYISIPVATAAALAENNGYPSVIPSMQGFYVNTSSAGTVRLDYERLVWNGDYEEHSNTALRAPRKGIHKSTDEAEITGSMNILLSSDGWNDQVCLLESPSYSEEYVNGYDARKMKSGNMNIFTVAGNDKLAVDATNSIIGTRVGVRTGEETAYTMTFSHVNSDDDLMLWDIEAEEKVEISEGQTYTFFAEPNSEITGRFIIVEAEAPEIATGVEDVQGDAKVHKFIKDDKLFILKNGVLYDATGMRVR